MSVPRFGLPTNPDWMTPEQQYNWYQNQQNQNQGDAFTQFRIMMDLYNQQYQNQAAGIQNTNQIGSMGNQVAGLGYNLYGDAQNLGLRSLGMQGDVLRQQRSDQQYQRGLQEEVARTQHQQSVNEVPTAFGMGRRLLGY
jgi:hypothetical protein